MRIEHVKSSVIGGAHFVEIITDNGITGTGQSAFWAYPEASHAIVTAFADYLIGQDPCRIEHHWQHLYRMGPFRGSALGGAISAVDIALWDIKGQFYQAPIWDLLGGSCRNKIRLHCLILGDLDAGEIAKVAAQAAEDGYTAIKFDPIPMADLPLDRLVRTVRERTAAARQAVTPDVDIILEFHRRLTPLQALPVAQSVQEFHPLFVEDPIQIDSIATQAELARKLSVPIGNGERLHSIWEFKELLASGGSQYIRPDLGLAGGLTHCKKIAAIAESHHAAVVTHNFLGPVLTAASVHLDACIPNFVTQEYSSIDETGIARKAYTSTLKRNGGYIELPEAPGLGVSLTQNRDEWLSPLTQPLHHIPLRDDGSVWYAV
jgi:galactonate dehydratase